MNRGEPLTWGITIERAGNQWTVKLVGSQTPDWYFDTFGELTEWLEDQHEGLEIERMGKGEAHMTTETGTVQVDLSQFGGDSSKYVRVGPKDMGQSIEGDAAIANYASQRILAQVTPDPSSNVVWDLPGLPAGLVWNVPLPFGVINRTLLCSCIDGVPPLPGCPVHDGGKS